MAVVTVADLKASLDSVLGRARRGETVVVTERGVPIAVVKPVKGRSARGTAGTLQDRLNVLAAEGLVQLPTRKPSKRFRPVKVAGKPLSRQVLEDRR